MLSYAVAVLLSYSTVVSSRETIRPMPTITHSLVNLGKMEISFHFNGRDSAIPDRSARMASFIKPELVAEESCPCSSLRNVKDSLLNNPAGIINKILMNNDLFSFNKDPVSSALCCESHEHIEEGTVVFEFPANPKSSKPMGSRTNARSNTPVSIPMMPFLFDTVIPNKSMLPPLKTKSIEIFLFPKKKELSSNATPKFSSKKRDLLSKDNIQIVGDKELKNNISVFKPIFPVVKKDLTFQEKNKKLIEKNQEAEREIESRKEKEQEKEREKEKYDIEKEDGDQIIIENAGKPNAL